MYKLIVFDWDGTLYDSTAHIVRHTQQTAHDLQLPVPTAAQARRIIGLIFHEAVHRLYPDLSEEKIGQFIKRYQEYANKETNAISGLYEGTVEVLQKLRRANYQLAIATSSSRHRLNKDLTHFALHDSFALTVCAEESAPKPHPQMLYNIMQYTGIEPVHTLMIGDTTYDMQMAINAKVTGLAVSCGAHNIGQLAELEIAGCLTDVRELLDWLGSRESSINPEE